LSFLAALNVSPVASGDNWPQWRGPAGTGVSAEKNLPLHWGTNENVRWRVPLPERGNSTPIVWGKRVFLTQAVEKPSHDHVLQSRHRQVGLAIRRDLRREGIDARNESALLRFARSRR